MISELRFWISDPANGTTNVRSEVMLNLWDLYHERGIELPYPQREVTFRNPEAVVRGLAKRQPPVAEPPEQN